MGTSAPAVAWISTSAGTSAAVVVAAGTSAAAAAAAAAHWGHFVKYIYLYTTAQLIALTIDLKCEPK
jgi:hypothetical protein